MSHRLQWPNVEGNIFQAAAAWGTSDSNSPTQLDQTKHEFRRKSTIVSLNDPIADCIICPVLIAFDDYPPKHLRKF